MHLALFATGFSFITVAASAQETAQGVERQGFWFSVGPGLGSRGLSCDNCIGAQREHGFSAKIGLGGTVSPQVTLGANLIGWITPDNRSSGRRIAVFSALMGVAQFYPVRRSGLFVQGGGGYIVDVVDDDLVLDAVGMIVGVGFDVRLGRAFSLTPQFSYLRTLDGGALTSSLYQFGVAATWH